MAKKKQKKCPECQECEKWAVPMADFFSLLLALFIALYAIASVNKERMQAVKEEFVKIYDFAPAPETVITIDDMQKESTPNDNTASPSGLSPSPDGGSMLISTPATPEQSQAVLDALQKVQKELKNISMGVDPLDQNMDGILLKLPTTVMFRGAEVSINDEETHLFLRRVADIINSLPPIVDISLRGFTDNLPITGGIYRDNLELSARRAESVMRELISNGVDPDRLSTAGFGSAKPAAPNNTEENRAKNRRVEMYMYVSADKTLEPERQTNILDALGKLVTE